LLKTGRKKKIPCQCIPEQRLNQIAETTKHQGVVALCTMKSYDTMETLMQRIAVAKTPPLLLVPASMEDPRNLGAIIRTSVAFGVTALLVERKKTVPLTATVAKASAGMMEYISVIKPVSLEKEIKELKEKGFQVIGAQGGSDKKPSDVTFTKPTILISGGEHQGIPPYLSKLCDHFVGIPMVKRVESLNVSVATSILLYECAKQRGFVFDLAL
jgi:23S rRNA (guanosine2251-2'-O)-methyltransferase